MIAALQFELPAMWYAMLPLAIALGFSAWRQRAHGLSNSRVLRLAALRLAPLLALVLLAARPVWIAKEPPSSVARSIVVLLDRSESMALEDADTTRYQRALGFLRDRLLPSFKSAGFPVQAMLFDKAAEPADGPALTAASPKGERTNLGGAIARALADSSKPPLAIVALTDGDANETSEDTRGLSALVDSSVPFIGVGFGSDRGVRTLTLREVTAPPIVATRTAFSVSAQLESITSDELPSFDLALFRDGQISQKKTITPGKGSRQWLENFQLTAEKESTHTYTVQLFPPDVPSLKCVNALANVAVRVSDQKELRVLYVQGSLTWDYKFISLALRSDQTIKLTGLTRTSKQSVFRQNVESAGELLNGFPNTLEEIAPYRVVVLSNLRPSELTAVQQDVLARFCSELGGGVLMIGGAGTFDGSWQSSRLEQLLPVKFAPYAGVTGLDRPFHVQLTDEALQTPVFQIADNRSARDAWAQLPTFTQYGRVDSAKPGAQVWALHQMDDGPQGRRILMASQHYGAGLSAVICIQNFWRWRLAKDSDAAQFDRFWRQFFRFLSEVGRQDVAIHLADQDLRPDSDIQVILEKQPNPKNVVESNRKFNVRVENSAKEMLREETVDLEPLRPVDFKFHAPKAGLYTVSVSDSLKVPIASRAIEIRNINVEFQNTARNMEVLQQWAGVSDGLAMKAEDCRDAGDLVRTITQKIEQARNGKHFHRPLGINGWFLSVILGSLGAEYILRKKWSLT